MAKKTKSEVLVSLENQIGEREGIILSNFLRDNATKVIDDDKIFIAYEEEEQGAKNSQYVQSTIELSREEETLNEYIKSAKAELKIKKLATKKMLKDIAAGGEYSQGKVYMFDDQDARLMYEFTEDGTLIRSRHLRPDERQSSVVSQARILKAS